MQLLGFQEQHFLPNSSANVCDRTPSPLGYGIRVEDKGC
jgi:hypothetical protein